MLLISIVSTYNYNIIIILVGLKVVEVAHDFQQQIKNYITNDLQLLNSYDTWHGMCNELYYRFLHVRLSLGTKNVAKGLTKITRGRGIDTIKAQLLDKSKYVHYGGSLICS